MAPLSHTQAAELIAAIEQLQRERAEIAAVLADLLESSGRRSTGGRRS
jgi:hypothetical protein